MTLPLTRVPVAQNLLARAIESDCAYFEMAAELKKLDGATMAWMPGLTGSPAAAVIQRVDPDAIAEGGSDWIANAETAMADVGASLCRIYLGDRHLPAEGLLAGGGYVARRELVFVDALPGPSIDVTLRRVTTEADWADKLRFHQAAGETPDGHGNSPAGWVELERRKCGAGLEAYLAEQDGEVVGAVGAIRCDNFLRTKNLVVHPARRRRGIASAMLGCIGAIGQGRGLPEQCVVAVEGEHGELVYRVLGMTLVGVQVEWSKPLAGGQR